MLLRPPPPTDLRPFVAMDWRLRGISLWRRSAREDGITLWRLFTSLTPSALMRRCGGIARAVQGPPSSGGDRVFSEINRQIQGGPLAPACLIYRAAGHAPG
jgi:hypothetical protein